jgi:hypothetical protein
MTLNELAAVICGKLNQTEPDDVALAKTFLKLRFKLIWQAALWKDSLFEYTQTLTSQNYVLGNTWIPAISTLLLPPIFTHVVAVRNDRRRLGVESSEHFYRMDFDSFTATGDPTQFRLLSPAVMQFNDAVPILIFSTSLDKKATLDYLNADSQVVRFGPSLLVPALEITTSRIDMFRQEGMEVIFADGTGSSPIFLRVPATTTSLPLRQRIQLIGQVPDGTVIRVLGKTAPPTFTADDDTPALTGVENCLIAFGLADMLESIRQFGKATTKQAEAVQLLDQLKGEQVLQQAHNKRLIPEYGYGDDYGLNSGLFATQTK